MNRVLIIDTVGCWHYVHEDALISLSLPEGASGRVAWAWIAGRYEPIEVLPDTIADLARWVGDRTQKFGRTRPV